MNKQECVKLLYKMADCYSEVLLDKNVLIIYKISSNKSACMETVFKAANFLHMTGISFPAGEEIDPRDFFSHCINRRLNPDMIEFREDGTTKQKLDVLPLVIKPDLAAKMVGEYKGGRIKLMTNRLVGGVSASIGFIEDCGRYYPNTIIKGDIRDDVDKTQRVLATFRKAIGDNRYSECTYRAKGVDMQSIHIPKPYEYLSKQNEEK